MYEKPIATIVFNGERWNVQTPLPHIRNKAKMATLITFTYHCTGGSNQSSNKKRRNERDSVWKEGSKTLYLQMTVIIKLENPLESSKKFL